MLRETLDKLLTILLICVIFLAQGYIAQGYDGLALALKFILGTAALIGTILAGLGFYAALRPNHFRKKP